ncbi:hypothetical protein T12_2117 [Trichinella patagoniensis]|uniref:Uncharacterized protein n=1 Tax=Trichinella patagoniensis TaxID=990121 RepID=A0A0V0Z525_9BILA|nr:hypothetical protein T12_2117 [Trichinella patagoniensis]
MPCMLACMMPEIPRIRLNRAWTKMAAAEVGPNWMERAEEPTPTNRMGRWRRDAVGNPPMNPKRTTAVGERRSKTTAPPEPPP